MPCSRPAQHAALARDPLSSFHVGRDEEQTLAHGEPLETTSPPNAEPLGPGDSSAGGLAQLSAVDRGRYELAEQIAAGGGGRISAAQDTRLARTVAIKQMHENTALAKADRFAREALLTARLQHPNIVPVYDAGRWPNGEPFIAMKLVSGKPLSEVIDGAGELRQRLRLLPHVLDCADAMAYAHSEGVIHRDLKPANVLVGSFGETVVIDWGLAKDIAAATEPEDDENDGSRASPSSSADLTIGGAMLGTPQYMAPEQAAGEPADARTDVYALGAMIYHVLTGRPPYTGASALEVVGRVLVGPPEPVEQVEPRAPEELVAIVRKAMARDPGARYPSATELAEDLRAYQQGRSVDAHRYTSWQLLLRWARRWRVAVAVAIATIVVVAIVGTIGFVGVLAQKRTAEHEAARAESERREATRQLDALRLERARHAVSSNPNRALAILKDLTDEYEHWGAAQIVASDAEVQGIAPFLRACRGTAPECPRGRYDAVAFSPDGGELAAVAHGTGVELYDVASAAFLRRALDAVDLSAIGYTRGGRLVVGRSDGRVELLDGDGTTTEIARHSGPVQRLYGVAGGRVVSVGEDNTLRLHDVAAGTTAILAKCDRYSQLALAPHAVTHDGTKVACAVAHQGLVRFDVVSGETRPIDRSDDAHRTRLVMSHDGAIVAYVTLTGTVALYDFRSGAHTEIVADNSRVSTLAFSSDGRRIALGRLDGALALHDLHTGVVTSQPPHAGVILGLWFASDGRALLSASGDGTVRLRDLTGNRQRSLRRESMANAALLVSHDGLHATVHAHDHSVRLWSLVPPEEQAVASIGARLSSVEVSASHDRLVVGGDDGTVALVDLDTGIARRAALGARIGAIAISGDGSWFIAGDDAGAVGVWSNDGAERRFATQGRPIRGAAAAVNGGQVAFAREGGPVVIVDTPTLETREAAAHEGGASGLRALPQGGFVAWGFDGTVALIDADANVRPRVLAHDDEVWRASSRPDGGLVASIGRDDRIRMFELATGTARELDVGVRVYDVLFTADGERMFLRGSDYAIHVLSVADGRIERSFRGHGAHIEDVDIVAGHPRMVSGSTDGTVRIWDMDTGEHRLLAHHRESVMRVISRPSRGEVVAVVRDGAIRRWRDDVPHERIALRRWLNGRTPDTTGEPE
jgi:WD40 repeat protein